MDISAFREKLSTELMPASIFGLDIESSAEHAKQYEALLDRYTFDGLKIGVIRDWIESQSDRAVKSFEPDPEETFFEFKFNKKSRQEYQVDAAGNVSEDGLFTTLGLAIDKTLHAGGPVKFKEGDTVLIDQKSAEGYQRPDGTQIDGFATREDVTKVAERFVRKLNDYPFLLRSFSVQTEELTEEIERVTTNNETAQTSAEDAEKQVNERDDNIEKLSADIARLSTDSEQIKALASDRTLQRDELNQRAEQLNQQIESDHRAIKQATGSQPMFPTSFGR